MSEPDEIELWQNENPVCPYCGDELADPWELEEDCAATECNECGKEYRYERIVTISYTTTKGEE